MAASITPGEAGMILEPVNMVAEWASRNYLRESIGLTAIDYKQFINGLQGEQQQWQQQQ